MDNIIPKNLNIRCSSNGIGDMVCGAYVAQSLKERFPNKIITYYVIQPEWFKYIDGVNIKHYLKMEQLAIDVYSIAPNVRNKIWNKISRKQLYCSKITFTKLNPKPPRVCVPNYNKFGSILLFPYALWKDRNWNLDGWISLEQRLYKTYKNVIVVGTPDQDVSMFMNGVNNIDKREVLELILNSKCVVSNDSGMAHIGGLYGIPTVAIINFFSHDQLFSHTDITTLENFNKITSKDVHDKVVEVINRSGIIKHQGVIESTIEI